MNAAIIKITRQFLVIFVALSAALVLAAVTNASSWTGPTEPPPGGNVPAPIHVGSQPQTKSGGLGAALVAANEFCLGGSCITSWPLGSAASISLSTSNDIPTDPPPGTPIYKSDGVTLTNCGSGCSTHADEASMQKLCSYTPYSAGFTSYKTGSYDSPSNNAVILWEGDKWIRRGANGRNQTVKELVCVKLTIVQPTQ